MSFNSNAFHVINTIATLSPLAKAIRVETAGCICDMLTAGKLDPDRTEYPRDFWTFSEGLTAARIIGTHGIASDESLSGSAHSQRVGGNNRDKDGYPAPQLQP